MRIQRPVAVQRQEDVSHKTPGVAVGEGGLSALTGLPPSRFGVNFARMIVRQLHLRFATILPITLDSPAPAPQSTTTSSDASD